MTIPRNLSFLAEGASSTGVLGTANGGTGLNTLGTAGQALVVNSGATGLTYSTPSAGAMTLISTQTASSSAISFTNLSGYDKYLLIFDQLAYGNSSGQGACLMQFGTGSGPTYITSGYYRQYTSVNTAGSNSGNFTSGSTNGIPFFASSPTYTGGYTNGYFFINNMTSGGDVSVFGICNGYHGSPTTNGYEMDTFSGGLPGNSTTKTAITIFPNAANFISGTASLYGISS